MINTVRSLGTLGSHVSNIGHLNRLPSQLPLIPTVIVVDELVIVILCLLVLIVHDFSCLALLLRINVDEGQSKIFKEIVHSQKQDQFWELSTHSVELRNVVVGSFDELLGLLYIPEYKGVFFVPEYSEGMLTGHQKSLVIHQSHDAESQNIQWNLQKFWGVLWLDVNHIILGDYFLFDTLIISFFLLLSSQLHGVHLTLGFLQPSQSESHVIKNRLQHFKQFDLVPRMLGLLHNLHVGVRKNCEFWIDLLLWSRGFGTKEGLQIGDFFQIPSFRGFTDSY